MKPEQQAYINLRFLNLFTRELILNSITKQKAEDIKAKTEVKLPEKIQQEIKTPLPKYPPLKAKINEEIKIKGFYLGKITPLANDLNITSIECPGPNKFITARTHHEKFRTSISLNKQEIKEILETFSEYGKKQINQGIFKASFSDLEITAIVAKFTDTRFIINRILTK